jgi:hypothetical protein
MLPSEFENYRRRLTKWRLRATENVLIISVCEKKLGLYRGSRLCFECLVSSAERGRSCREGSLGTPWGLHAVAEKHGSGLPEGAVLVGRQFTGECWFDRADCGPDQKALVTTRILRLRGLEEGINIGPGIDSFNRFIYLHGTNHPNRFPENISAGCLLLNDPDLLTLFNDVPVGTHVWLSEPDCSGA